MIKQDCTISFRSANWFEWQYVDIHLAAQECQYHYYDYICAAQANGTVIMTHYDYQ